MKEPEILLDRDNNIYKDLRIVATTKGKEEIYYLLTKEGGKEWGLPGGIARFSKDEFNRKTIESVLIGIAENVGLGEVNVDLDKNYSQTYSLDHENGRTQIPLFAYYVEASANPIAKIVEGVYCRWFPYSVALKSLDVRSELGFAHRSVLKGVHDCL